MKTSKLIFFLAVFTLYSLLPEVQGELKTINITGKITNKKITFDVYLPENYNKNGPGYPVIYNLHGRGGSHKSGEAFRVPMQQAIAKGILQPVIGIYPDGTKNVFRSAAHGDPIWNDLLSQHQNFELVMNGHFLDNADSDFTDH